MSHESVASAGCCCCCAVFAPRPLILTVPELAVALCRIGEAVGFARGRRIPSAPEINLVALETSAGGRPGRASSTDAGRGRHEIGDLEGNGVTACGKRWGGSEKISTMLVVDMGTVCYHMLRNRGLTIVLDHSNLIPICTIPHQIGHGVVLLLHDIAFALLSDDLRYPRRAPSPCSINNTKCWRQPSQTTRRTKNSNSVPEEANRVTTRKQSIRLSQRHAWYEKAPSYHTYDTVNGVI